MSEIMTPMLVEQRLRELGRELNEAHELLVRAEHAYADAKSAWEINSARERLRVKDRALERGSKITVQEIEDTALVNRAQDYTMLNTTDAVVRSMRANVARIRVQIDIARSVGTSVRASMEVS